MTKQTKEKERGKKSTRNTAQATFFNNAILKTKLKKKKKIIWPILQELFKKKKISHILIWYKIIY